MKKSSIFLLTFLTLHLNANHILHHDVSCDESAYVWEKNSLSPFDELIISWDSQRPNKGHYLIQVSLFIKEWSPWLNYAFWGAADQYTFNQCLPEASTFQDGVNVADGKTATAFKILVTAMDGASLKEFRTLHACMTNLKEHHISHEVSSDDYLNLAVNGLSQIALPDQRCKRLCSPTSTTAVINYLSPSLDISPLTFADHVWDSAFDIYGNWIFNTAQASHLLGPSWSCHVARLMNFDQIIKSLQQGYPVVVSVKGFIPGAAHPYNEGHLIVIKGYDPAGKVLCMDPAFPQDAETLVSYELKDFLAAWEKRKGIAYLFSKKQSRG